MLSIGLTGGIGSGKTVVAKRFAEHGIALIDTDQIAHSLTSAGGAALPWIAETFGTSFITPEGALDRAQMRHLIFSDEAARQRLQDFLHPLILAECERATQTAQSPYLILIVPLLIELDSWKKRVDRVLVVDCPPETQVTRVMLRNGLTRAEVLAIMSHQASREQRCAQADEVLCNDDTTSLTTLYEQVDELHKRYLNLASTHNICPNNAQTPFATATRAH